MDDPRLIELHRAVATRPARAASREPQPSEAAVSLVLRPRDQLELLLIKRAIHEHDPWSGHVALPGGRRDVADEDLKATAIRETAEEVGITLHDDTFIGQLDEIGPSHPRLPPLVIAPFVFGVPSNTVATADPVEVDAAIWVPLSALRDPQAASELLVEMSGLRRTMPSLVYGDYVIWGLTHRILVQFLELSEGLF